MQGRIYAAALLAAVLLASLWGAAALGTPQSDPNAEANHTSRIMPVKPEQATVSPGFDRRHIEVKFTDELDIGLSTSGTPMDRQSRVLQTAPSQVLFADILFAGGRWQRMTGDAEFEIDLLVQNAEARLGRDIADLNNYFILTVPDGVSTEMWLNRLNALPEVEIALALPLPAPAPLPPNYQGNQGYLGAAPGGIEALASWALPGGTGAPTVGSPVVVCDFEYSWNLTHNDLPATITGLIPSGYTVSDPFADDNHGTAVLGELLSINNGWGTTGASYGIQGAVAPTYLNSAWLLGVAMSNAMTVLGPGDVFLIEQQMQGPNYPGPGPQDGLVPVEWWASWYYTIVTAVGNGIHVVEAAGNGREDLDAAVYGVGHAPFQAQNNSGAIIVGAGAVPGGSDTDRSRLGFSNWGSRVDLQGWGESVYTTGYGDLYSAEGTDYYYTSTFAGTSSASPNVASAVAILESVYESTSGGIPLSTHLLRSILNSTGSPQQAGTYPVTQNIGPRPNLGVALRVLPTAPDTCEYYKAPYVDYAPNGMPDFDQKQDQWRSPASGAWSHCGPTALANCFWWFDSKFESSPVDPRPFYPGTGTPAPNDGYNLVYSFDPTGMWDDHDTNNVMPLIDSLARYCNTNPGGQSGTNVQDLANGAANWLGAVGLAGAYTVDVHAIDDTWGFDELREEVLRSQDVILLLGFWEEMAPGVCERIGGHYVTAAGVCPDPLDTAICVSDPYFDKNEGEPPAGTAHGSSVHNDAFRVSGPHGTIHHDRYDATLTTCQPFQAPFFQLELVNYPVGPGNVVVWQGQNSYDPGLDPIPPRGGLIHTLLEFAVVICPVEDPNHFKTWGIEPHPVDWGVSVEDQFMTDELRLTAVEFLSNPTRKDTFDITRPDDHLLWYRAHGRDTLLSVEFENQFGLDTVIIDSVTHLLVPCQKLPHDFPDTLLAHYKAYRIRDGHEFVRPTELQDQFDAQPELIDLLVPVFFLTPAIKNGEPLYDSLTHYVAYDFQPKHDTVINRVVRDRFGTYDIFALRSEMLLVPTQKLSFTAVTDTIPGDDPCWYYKPGYPEYAPNGIPDFDQKQDAWTTPGTPLWSWCGPTSVANCIWWFDSKFHPVDLVPAYVVPGEHDPTNVPPFISALATCMNTDLIIPGTDVQWMQRCIDDWLTANALDSYFVENTYKAPDFFFVEEEIERSQNVILLLGFWELDPDGTWYRVGGHYVTCGGVCSDSLWIAISDPYYDYSEGHPPGAPHAATLHNDAALISGPHGTNWHDRYRVNLSSPSPGGTWWLPEYPIAGDPEGLENFNSQNCPEEFQGMQRPYSGGPIHTEIEYAVIVCPTDRDLDSIPDIIDNCPDVPNPDQADDDADSVGNVCDNCPDDPNPDQSDVDLDGVGDVCDNCPNDYNPLQEDSNSNGIGDSCEVSMPPGDDPCWYFKPGYVDYAPYGVPDFDQKQDAWTDPAGLQWTWCGPVSLANCLWWFDAKYDTISLIPTYGAWPVHDVRNVPPFIEALSVCMNVDLVKPGTDVHFMESCVQSWMAAQGYPFLLIEKTYKAPDFTFIEDEIKRSENVILLLGFWEQLPTGGYQRVGGHYVTCAGVCSESLWIAISDPYFDYAEGGLSIHGPTAHNDAALISGPHGTNWHDRYRIDTLSESPGGTWWIPEYPITLFAPVATNNFDGLNTPEEFVPQEGPWQGGVIYTEVEYAVAISPCPVVKTGDVNVDGSLTSADIIYLVNHVFKGGPAPLPCSAAGDVNCDGVLTSADIIYMVNHIFKGGPPPCDVCRLIAAGTWTCP